MLPSINLFGVVDIGLYGTIFILAFVLALAIGRGISLKDRVDKGDVVYAAIYSLIGLGIGMKLLFFVTKLPRFIAGFGNIKEAYDGDWMGILAFSGNYLFGGNVFYGGLIGALIGIIIYCRKFKVDIKPIMDVYAVMIPFVHGFGRIGCFCAGCCYGMEYHGPLAVQFPHNEYIPELDLVPRFPTQLTETFFNFIAFFILLYLYRVRKLKEGRILGVYLCYYAVFRFIMEFFRGDITRGSIYGVTTSQIVSLVLIPIGILILCGKIMPNKKAEE